MGQDECRCTAIFAGGCFWGVEHLMRRQLGVISVVSGYVGGHIENPTYEQVCSGTTGHVEAVQITFDSCVVDYETLARLFFEIHDFTQCDGQGPDLGSQYRSVIFHNSEQQRQTAERLIGQLVARGYDVATELREATTFYPAESYHQRHYDNSGQTPYCHARTKRF